MINIEGLAGAGFLDALLVMILAAYSQYVALRGGIFSMATAGFMALGAYGVAVLTVKFHVSPWIAAVAGIALAVLGGAILGVLVGRLRDAYQSIATLSFVLMLQQFVTLWKDVTGGPFGITGIPLFAQEDVLVGALVVILIVVVFVELIPIGRKQAAIRIDEVAAASLGTDVAKVNLVTMIYSAAIGGVAGALMAGNQFAVDPTGFSFGLVISVLGAVIIGGYRSFLGPLFGSIVAVALPILFSKYQVLASTIVAVITLIVLGFAPRGLAALTKVDSELFFGLLHRLPKRRSDSSRVSREGSWLQGKKTSDAALVASDIARAYGSVRAVDGVSLSVRPGQIVGLIGPNGAGKTSVINLLAGATALDRGSVSIGEHKIEKLPAFRVQREGVARTFQTCRLFHEHSVWSNVVYAATCGRPRSRRHKLSDDDCAAAAMTLTNCLDLANRRAGDLAYAYQRRVEIARALACEPTFLLLDEPAAGMTKTEAAELGDILRAVAALGVGILVVDHNVPWILSLCDIVNVQHLGKIIASGPPAAVRDDPEVIAAYTGDHTGGEYSVPADDTRRVAHA